MGTFASAAKYNFTKKLNIRRDIEVGTFASAACGRRSEQKGVAAVKIFARKCVKNFGHRNRT